MTFLVQNCGWVGVKSPKLYFSEIRPLQMKTFFQDCHRVLADRVLGTPTSRMPSKSKLQTQGGDSHQH